MDIPVYKIFTYLRHALSAMGYSLKFINNNTMKTTHYKFRTLLFGILLFLACATLHAQTTYYGTSAGTAGTDNSFFGGQSGYSIKSSGNYNAFFGYEAGYANTTGSSNVFTGTWAGFSNTTGSNNVYTGIGAGYTTSAGSYNVFTGNNAGNHTLGNSNSFYGAYSGYTNTTGYQNVFIGDSAGYSNTTGSQNVFNGYLAGYSNTSGGYNVFSGQHAARYNTTGSYNAINGYESGAYNSTGSYNVFTGPWAGLENTTGSGNVYTGSGAGYATNTGSNNVFIGNNSGNHTLTNSNSFYGAYSGYTNTTGHQNVFIGDSAGYSNNTGSNNSFFGMVAGLSNTTGHQNTFLGDSAGYSNTTGYYNTFIGEGAGLKNATGTFNDFTGLNAGYTNTTGNNNVFDGVAAGRYNTTGSDNTIIGTNAGFHNTIGNNNNFMGLFAGYNDTSGSNDVFNGYAAGYTNSTGNYNVFDGYETGFYNTTGSYNVFSGPWAGLSNTTGSGNVYTGSGAGYATSAGSNNVFTGNNSGNHTLSNSNSFYGAYSGYANTTGLHNVFIGDSTGYSNTSGNYNLFTGTHAGFSNTIGYQNVFNGDAAGYENTTGNNNVFDGYAAGNSNTHASGNVFVGSFAGSSDTNGIYNVFIGFQAGTSNYSGSGNVFSGTNAGVYNLTGNDNVFIGYTSGYSNQKGFSNSFYGANSGFSNTTGAYNSLYGDSAGYNNTGGHNSFFGYAAGYSNTTGNHNTLIGDSANVGSASLINATAIGNKAIVSQSNAIVLGNGSANIGVGTSTPNKTAVLDLTSTTQGLLIPRMTTTQRKAISSPATGLEIYDNTLNQLYVYNGTSWAPFSGITYTAGGGVSIYGTTISADSNSAVWNANKLEGTALSSTTPTSGQVLEYNSTSSKWVPTTLPNGTTYTAGGGVTISGSKISADSNTAVWNANKIQGKNISPKAPSDNQVLKYNNGLGEWTAATDTGVYTASNGVSISGTTISGAYTAGGGVTISGAKISADSNNAVWNANKLEGTALSSTTPTSGQVLEYNSTSSKWVPTTLSSGTTYTAGGGVTISGSKISADSNTAVWNANKLEGTALSSTTPTSGQVLEYNSTSSKWVPTTLSSGTTYTAGGGVTISGSKISADSNTAVWNANKIQGRDISLKAPSNNEVLKYNSGLGEWTAATDTGIYTGSNGVSISGTTISGAYAGSNGVSVSGSTISGNYSAGGGVTISGSKISADSNTAVWNADKLEGTALSSSTPSNGQVLQYNSSASKWEPATLSGGSSYTAGGGITISGSTITADSTHAVWNANKLQGNNISATSPATKQVLKWNGTSWAPANDSTTTYTGSNGVSVSGTTISGSYTGGTGISVSGSTISAANTIAQWNSDQIEGEKISPKNPANNQVLKWNSGLSEWTPATDTSANYSAGTGISISGSSINSSWSNNGNNLSNNNSGNVGIGKTNPYHGLDTKNGVNTDSAYFIKGNEVLSTNSSYTNATAIGAGTTVFKSNSIALGGSGTQVGLGGITAPGYTLQLATNSAAKPGSATWTIASDARLKTDITPYTDGLDVLNQINPVWFQYSGEAGMPVGQKFVGVLAQDIQKIAPYMVGTWNYEDKNGNKTNYLDYDANSLFYILVNSVKAQQQQIAAQQQTNTVLQQQIEAQQLQISTKDSLLNVQQLQINDIYNRLTLIEQCTNCVSNASNLQNNTITNQVASLDQNIPNPFSQNTVIGYYVPQITKSAYIAINTLQGNQIQSFVISNTGKGQIMLSSGVLAAGDYIYTLVVDGVKVDSKKMMIVKE